MAKNIVLTKIDDEVVVGFDEKRLGALLWTTPAR